MDQWFRGFRTKHWKENCAWYRTCDQIYEVKSSLPRRPGKGGDGGHGGYGGKAGQILIISTDEKSEIGTISRDGMVHCASNFSTSTVFRLFINLSWKFR